MVEPEEITPPPIPVAAEPEPKAIGFRNGLAVRIGLFLSMLTMLVSVLIGPFVILWMLVAGGLAAWLYKRRTGEVLSAWSGARLGWITGLFTFLILMVLISTAAFLLTDPAFVDMFLAQMRQRGAGETAKQVVDALQSPGRIAAALVQTFIFCGLLPVLGGMLGAKLFGGPRTVVR
jgi:hypothetical protein